MLFIINEIQDTEAQLHFSILSCPSTCFISFQVNCNTPNVRKTFLRRTRALSCFYTAGKHNSLQPQGDQSSKNSIAGKPTLVHKEGLCVFEIKLLRGLYHTAHPHRPYIYSPYLLEDSLWTLCYRAAKQWRWLSHAVLLKLQSQGLNLMIVGSLMMRHRFLLATKRKSEWRQQRPGETTQLWGRHQTPTSKICLGVLEPQNTNFLSPEVPVLWILASALPITFNGTVRDCSCWNYDLKFKQSKKLKSDFMALIDTVLESRNQCVFFFWSATAPLFWRLKIQPCSPEKIL